MSLKPKNVYISVRAEVGDFGIAAVRACEKLVEKIERIEGVARVFINYDMVESEVTNDQRIR